MQSQSGSTGFREALVQSRVRSNRVPEKVPKVPEKVWSGSTGFLRKISEKVWEALVWSQVKFNRQVTFNRIPEKVPEKVWEALVQSYRLGSTGFRRRFWRSFREGQVQQALVQSQVRFNRVPEKVLEKVGEALVQSQVTFNRVPEKVQQGSGEDSGEGLGGLGAESGQVQQDLRPFNSRKPS